MRNYQYCSLAMLSGISLSTNLARGDRSIESYTFNFGDIFAGFSSCF